MRTRKFYLVRDKVLIDFIKSRILLSSLEKTGVDNWEGYSRAKNLFLEEYKEEHNKNIDYDDFVDLLVECRLDNFEAIEVEADY